MGDNAFNSVEIERKILFERPTMCEPRKDKAERAGKGAVLRERVSLGVWGRLNAHRSQVATAFIAAHAQDYAVAYLPANAPELNPEEHRNAFVKRAMDTALPGSVADLHRLARHGSAACDGVPNSSQASFDTQASSLPNIREDN